MAEYVDSHGSLTEYTTTRLLRKILEGLQYLHEAKIIHVNLTVSHKQLYYSGNRLLVVITHLLILILIHKY